MASQQLRHRPKDGPPISSTTAPKLGPTVPTAKRAKKLAMARKGLRSLALAVTVPLTLASLSAYSAGCSSPAFLKKPTWHPPIWAFHLASVSTAGLMGLAGWLVWAEGAFHREPAVLGMYVAQLLLGLIWPPVVFGLRAVRAGLVLCVLLFGVMFMCAQCFRKVNPIAGDLVKPCLAWASFLAVFNYKLV